MRRTGGCLRPKGCGPAAVKSREAVEVPESVLHPCKNVFPKCHWFRNKFVEIIIHPDEKEEMISLPSVKPREIIYENN